MSAEERIDLWAERGVPHSEIKKRLPERSDKDCLTAWKWLREWGIITKETSLIISESADATRSAAAVLEQFEPFFLKAVDQSADLPKPLPSLPLLLELNALVVEAYVRAANHCFPPLHGRN